MRRKKLVHFEASEAPPPSRSPSSHFLASPDLLPRLSSTMAVYFHLPLCYARCIDQHAQPKKLASADEQAAGRLGEHFLPRALRFLLPKQGGAVLAKASSVIDMDRAFGNPGTSGVWPRFLKR